MGNKLKEKLNLGKIFSKEPMSLKKSILMIVLMSYVAFLMQSVVQNDIFSTVHFLYNPLIVLLNMLPVFLIILLVYFITGHIWLGCAITYLPLIMLNIASYYKTVFRDEPLKMSDLQLVSEMNNITQNYEFKISLGIIIGVLLLIAAIVFAIKYLKSQKIKIPVRITGVVITICCMLLSYNFIYTNKDLYNKIPTKANEYHDTSVVSHHGMIYSLLISSQATTYDMPEGYSDETAMKLLAETASIPVAGESTEKINVLAIMGEAFFDVTRGETVDFLEGENPYKNYERIKNEGYHGKLVVPGYGGGTECAEFEFLTGTNQYLLDPNMPTVYKTYITQPVYSLVRYFKDEGYKAIAIHPGYSWFYNRQNAYAYLGFDKFISRDDMGENIPRIYGYATDEFTTGHIIDNYISHYNEKPDEPYFNFTITIQNHGPYPDVECGRDEIYIRPDNMSDENYYIINNYLNGIRDTDKLLGDVCNFAAEREEPVAVLFFGDHLPYLDENIECFDALGYNISHRNMEGIQNKYTVEYVMWCNDAARQVIEKSRGAVKSGEGPEISSNYLGVELLDYLGVEKPSYFEFVSKVEEKISVISPHFYKKDDAVIYELDKETEKLLEDYKILQYYNLRQYK